MARPGWRRLFGVRQEPLSPAERPMTFVRPEGEATPIAATSTGVSEAASSGRRATMSPKRYASQQEREGMGHGW